MVSEKIQLEFLYVHIHGPRSRNDLDLQYSHIFIYSIRCQLLLPFWSLAAIVSEKSTVFIFSERKTSVTKFDLVTPGSLNEQTMMGLSPLVMLLHVLILPSDPPGAADALQAL